MKNKLPPQTKKPLLKPFPPSGYIIREDENPKSKKARLRNHQVFLNDLAGHIEKEYRIFDNLPRKLREIAKDII